MDIGKNLIEYCKKENYRIKEYNIIYLEGCDNSFQLNNDYLDQWNDVRLVIKENGEIIHNVIATTEPGKYYTNKPLNKHGAFRIAFGQYLDAWTIGKHKTQDALVQIAPVKGHRDFNKDGFRTNDLIVEGIFGINQHHGGNDYNSIGLWSAGCLVGLFEKSHDKFMQICRDTGYKNFDTTILPANKLKELNII